MRDVTGKVAFITGGASGLGLAMARSFSAAGMNVAIADIEQGSLDRVQAEFNKTNARVITLKVDVTDRDAMEQAARRTEAAFGKIHVVCNNAGVAVGGAIDAMSYKDWDWVMGVNVAGVINGVQTFVDRIKSHGEGGHIVNTASIAGQVAFAGLGVYNTSKFAVVGLSEALRADLAVHNIGVSVLCPGVVSTNIFTSGRNRPSGLQTDADTASLVPNADGSDAQRAARLSEIMAAALDPAVVGDMVLAAIQANDAYIFSHPEMQPMVDARSAAIAESFARWSKYRTDHGV